MSKPTADDGALCANYTNWDPFVVSPQFQLKPKTGQYVEIRMKSTGYGPGEIFYASSNEGPYNGFSQEKTALWEIIHDGKWHTYQILPAWLAEPQIIKLRVDLGRPTDVEIKDGANVAIDYIRIIDINIDETTVMEKCEWNADDLEPRQVDSVVDRNGWMSEIGLIDPSVAGSNLYVQWEKTQDADPNLPFPRASLRFLTGVQSGVLNLEIPLFNLCTKDGVHFERNVDLSAFGGWGEKAYRWEIYLPKGFVLKTLAFSKGPKGQGALETQGNGNQVGLARVPEGQKTNVRYEALVRNCGGDALANFYVKANVDPSVKLTTLSVQKIAVDPLLGFNPTGDRLASKGVDNEQENALVTLSVDQTTGEATFPKELDLKPNEAFQLVATYEVAASGDFQTAFTFGAKDQVSVAFEPNLKTLPDFVKPKCDYVPEPQPVESEFELGAFYFPGWSKRSGWDKIDEAAPVRKPLLGYYDEANPEVVDWQIKWAAENGIKFFFVDWYWRHGNVSLEHWVRAFQQAKYRSNLKWAVMWANHTGYGTHSTEDWKVVTKYWIDNYFNTPEYYTIDGKPVVVMWDHSIVDHDMIEEAKKEGLELKPGEGCKRAFDICRKMCVEAGYPGVYFIAIKWPEHAADPATVQKYANAGFDATTIYHFMYPGKGVENQTLYSFDKVVDASRPNWEERFESGIIPSIPNISTGWDSRPWHGFRNTVVYGRSVESFQRLLNDFKEFAQKTGVKRAVLAPLNEWGEGSYIEPNNEFGFGMYEAIRKTLCKEPEGGFPVNYAPYEVGLGPYDLPKDK